MTRLDEDLRALMTAARRYDEPTSNERSANRRSLVRKLGATGLAVPLVSKGTSAAVAAASSGSLTTVAGGSAALTESSLAAVGGATAAAMGPTATATGAAVATATGAAMGAASLTTIVATWVGIGALAALGAVGSATLVASPWTARGGDVPRAEAVASSIGQGASVAPESLKRQIPVVDAGSRPRELVAATPTGAGNTPHAPVVSAFEKAEPGASARPAGSGQLVVPSTGSPSPEVSEPERIELPSSETVAPWLGFGATDAQAMHRAERAKGGAQLLPSAATPIADDPPMAHPPPHPALADIHYSPAVSGQGRVPYSEPVARGAAPSRDTSDLHAALAALAEAQRLLAGGQADQAVVELDRFSARTGTQAMWEERRALRCVALCQMGHSSAREEAAHFLSEAAQSPMAIRVRQACQL